MDLERDEFRVAYHPKTRTVEDLVAAVSGAGYRAEVVSGTTEEPGSPPPHGPPPVEHNLPPLVAVALAKAKAEGKPLLIEFSAVWCGPCKRMAKETLGAEVVKERIAKFVTLLVDTDEKPEVSRAFDVQGIPDVRMLDGEGQEIDRLRGFEPPERFAERLDRALAAARKPALAPAAPQERNGRK